MNAVSLTFHPPHRHTRLTKLFENTGSTTENTYHDVGSHKSRKPFHVMKAFSCSGVLIYALTMSELFPPREGGITREPIVLRS